MAYRHPARQSSAAVRSRAPRDKDFPAIWSIRGYTRRKADLRQRAAASGSEALTIFAADKLAKVRELRAVLSRAARRREPIEESLVPPRRLAHLRHCLGVLEERLGDSPLVNQLRTELSGLDDDLRSSPASRIAA